MPKSPSLNRKRQAAPVNSNPRRRAHPREARPATGHFRHDESVEVSGLIGDIYDAALDPELWPGALASSARFVGGTASALFLKDSVRKTHNTLYTWGYDLEYTKSYIEKFGQFDPFAVAQFFFEIDQPISLADILPHAEFRKSVFYQQWVRPQHWIDAIAATLERSATTYAAFSVIRHEDEGIIDDEARRRMSLIVPHVRRAVVISKVIDLHKVEAAAFADTLDGLTAAMFLVDAAGRIVHANAAAHAMLNEAAVVRAAGGKLAAGDTVADCALHDIFANAEAGDAAVGTTGVAVPLAARTGERYVAHVLPLTSGARRKAGAAYSAVAAVFVRRAALELPHPMETVATTFKLSPAEMRILMMIVEVGGVSEVAQVLGLSEATVKTHLQHIFAKTETSRQADLVKLVAGYMGPLL
jgi:DNA-binding CsgD family transcriptional regulator/PAS domain-containing protein